MGQVIAGSQSNAAPFDQEYVTTTKSGTKTYLDSRPSNVSSAPLYTAEVPFTSYLTGDISGSTTEVEAKVGGSALSGRRYLSIQNTSTMLYS